MIFIVCFMMTVAVSIKSRGMNETYGPGMQLQNVDKPGRYQWKITWLIVGLFVLITVILELRMRFIPWCKIWKSRHISMKYQEKIKRLRILLTRLDIEKVSIKSDG